MFSKKYIQPYVSLSQSSEQLFKHHVQHLNLSTVVIEILQLEFYNSIFLKKKRILQITY